MTARTFSDVFGSSPSVMASAPGRVNLLGEHTDYNDGLVLPAAIGQRTHIAVAPNGGESFRLYSAELEEHVTFSIDSPPAPHFASYVYGCLREFSESAGSVPPLDMHVSSTVPIGAGLSSSAALEVALLRALRELSGASIDDVQIAKMAQQAEVRYAGVNVGLLDQMASSLAEQGSMLFLDMRTLEREQRPLPAEAEILVMHSGIERSLAATAYNQRREECRQAAELAGRASLRDVDMADIPALPPPLMQRARHVVSENARVSAAMRRPGAAALGQLMSESHASLRDDYEVSIPPMDMLVSLLQEQEPVFGAKLTGAGFGGACVALCRRGSAVPVAHAVLARYAKRGGRGSLLVPAPD